MRSNTSGTLCRRGNDWLMRGTLFALALAVGVVALGAYVRLSDAGLSCPDWPGCYGRIAAPATQHDVAVATQAFPLHPVETAKARIEMTHRYLAGGLGVAIAMLFFASWRARAWRRPGTLPTLLLLVVIAQALLGRWTATGLLHPAVVTAHLLGGLTTLGLLGLFALRLRSTRRATATASVQARRSGAHLLATLVLCAAIGQVVLGGWTSSNNAALACDGFPTCHAQWWPAMDFSAAFALTRPAMTVDTDPAALIAIHWSHRLGALLLVTLSVALAIALWRGPRRRWGIALLGLLAVQVGLGIANVLLARPLAFAVLHNVCAALVLLCVIAINFYLHQGEGAQPEAVHP